MAATLRQVEGVPVAWPATPAGLTAAAAALDAGMIWARLEAWIAYRWSTRSIVWTVEGDGEWVPPLAPATITTVEVWQAGAWAAVTLTPGPLGGYVLNNATYRCAGAVGAGPVPVAGQEAYRRLAEYMAEGRQYGLWKGRAGASSVSVDLGDLKQSFDRAPAWLAKAMHNSGAGDLLRPYRRVQ